MKKIFIVLSLMITAALASGQVSCGFIAMPEEWRFDGDITPFGYLLQIDKKSNPKNIWQIGIPQKPTIHAAYSSPNVIITDTLKPYPLNDTSVFIFKHIDMGGYSTPHSAELAGYYRVNSDSLRDFGTMEISLNHGATWVNLLTDTAYSAYYAWQSSKPTLTGNSNGWQNFWVLLAGLGIPFPVQHGDTILLKFTFISDGIAETLDGLAFDNFQFCDGTEGMNEIPANSLISVYPNPTTDLLYISRHTPCPMALVQVYSYTGQLLYEEDHFISGSIDTRKLNLAKGTYFLKVSESKRYTVQPFVVER